MKFGTELECRLVAQVVCAFVVSGKRWEAAQGQDGASGMLWLQSGLFFFEAAEGIFFGGHGGRLCFGGRGGRW